MTVEPPDTFPIAVIEDDSSKEISIIPSVHIPEGTKDDTEWAQRLLNTSWSMTAGTTKNRGKKFTEAVESGKLWRVDYAFNFNVQTDEKFITRDIGRRALNRALKKGHREVADFLLSKDCVGLYGYSDATLELLGNIKYKDILEELVKKDKININAYEQSVLYYAVNTRNEAMCLFVLSLGSQYNHALSRLRNGTYNNTEIDILDRVIKKFKSPNFNPETIFDKKAQAIEAIEEAADTQWEAVDDNIIVKHTAIVSTNTTIQTMFNFVARDVSAIFISNPDVASTVVIRNFKDIEDETILYEAWNKLKALDKNPVPFTGKDNFKVYKSSKEQKVKIESS